MDRVKRDNQHLFIVRVAELLHQFGAPAHRLEQVVTQTAASQGIDCVVLYTPTALVVSLGTGANAKTYLRRVSAKNVNASKLADFDEVLEELEQEKIDWRIARSRTEAIAAKKSIYPLWLLIVASGFSCAAIAILLKGNLIEATLAAAVGGTIALFESLQNRLRWESGFVHAIAGFLSAITALAFSHFVVAVDDRLVTLSSLIILLPGLSLTVGLNEISVGHLSSGTSRLAGAAVTLLVLMLGVAIAWRIAGAWHVQLIDEALRNKTSLPDWSVYIAICLAPFGFVILFNAKPIQWPVIVAVCIAGVLTHRLIRPEFGPEVASFFGAMAVGCSSNLYARIRNRPALIVLAPSLLILVPGSVGYQSAAAMLEKQAVAGLEAGFSMLLIGISLVGGLLASSTLLPPKRIL